MKRSGNKRNVKHRIEVIVKDALWRDALPNIRHQVAGWCREVLAAETTRLGTAQASVTVVLANDRFLQSLNHDFRGKNAPTNVLSFPMLNHSGNGGNLEISEEPVMLGDIALARETILREAWEQGKEPRQHLAHMVVHGCLHLLGYDHQEDADAEHMEKLEALLLARWDIPDPYVVRA